MDTYQEFHAFIEGVSEGFCLWRARYELSHELLKDLQRDHHYYSIGRALGLALLIAYIAAIIGVLI